MALKTKILNPYRLGQLPKCDLLDQYAEWMIIFRNSSMVSVKKHIRYLTLFFNYPKIMRCQMKLNNLSYEIIETFYLDYCESHGDASRAQMRSILRVFLRFCFAEGYIRRDLSIAVPTFRTYRLSKIPDSIAEEDVQKMMRHIDRTTGLGRRDYAIMKLLYIYGVRSKQIRILRFSDINWRKNEINFPPMKDGKPISQPLTASTGEAILDYLQHGRPAAHFSEIFLTAQRPYKPFSNASSITNTTYRCARVAGIQSKKISPHKFRHAFAKRMLQQGYSLKPIADMLGHTRLQTTFIYSKVDFLHLNKVPLEWPEDTP